MKQVKNTVLSGNLLKLNIMQQDIRTSQVSVMATPINVKKTTTTGFEYNNRIFALTGISRCAQLRAVLKIFSKRQTVGNSLLLLKNKKYQFLKRSLQRRWLFLKNNKFYKGLRYAKGLPIRGQRTHTNASTSRKLNYVIS